MKALCVRLVCDYCGDALEFDLDGSFASHGEYHECCGERVRTIALVQDDGVQPTKDWVSVEVEHGG